MDTDTHRLRSTVLPGQVRLGRLVFRAGVLLWVVAGVVLEHGFYGRPIPFETIHRLQVVLLAVYGLEAWMGRYKGRRALGETGQDWVDGLLLIAAVFGIGLGVTGLGLGFRSWWLFESAVALLCMIHLWRLNVGLSRRFYRPGVLLPASFVTMIMVGTPLLMLPKAVPVGQSIGFWDACFTATSAVCVTGLVVRDTATGFTPLGQAIIGVLIQMGGLGIIIFGSTLAMLLGNRPSLRENLSLSTMLNDLPWRRVTAYVRFIVVVTLLVELAGAAAMMGVWRGDLGWERRAGLSLFHAVSAFCNAGFALQSDSLEAYRYSVLTHVAIAGLLVMGGIGFPVLDNLYQTVVRGWKLRRSRARCVSRFVPHTELAGSRISLHTKVVLTTTLGLYLYGVVVIGVGQLKPYLDDVFDQGVTANRVERPAMTLRRFGAVLADASFMSISSRTGGFNSMPMDEVSPAGRVALMTQMLVGASPGGTGGGMKTTTLAVLWLTVLATLRRRDQAEAFARLIGHAQVHRAATLAACFLALVTLATLLLSLSEPYPFIKVVFEVISAASTTGLSLGITGDLTAFGKVVIIATMFLGRVGPLALLGALLFGLRREQLYAYPQEAVIMG